MKISVVVPTRNRPDMLARALESIVVQTVLPEEVVVVDDGKKLSAETVCASVQSVRLVYLRTTGDTGGSAARNRGIEVATGDCIAFLDDDDKWLPEKLERQGELLSNASPDVGFSFTSVQETVSGVARVTQIPAGELDFSQISLSRFKMSLTSTLMVRKHVFDAVGAFDESFPSHQDAELFIRMAQHCKGIGLNEPLTVMASETRDHIGDSLEKKIEGRVRLLAKHRNLYDRFPSILAREYFRLALLYRDGGHRDEMREALRQSLKLKFSLRTAYHYLFAWGRP